MIYLRNTTDTQTVYVPSTAKAHDGTIRLRLYNVINNTTHEQGVSVGAGSGGGAFNLDFDFSFLTDAAAAGADYSKDYSSDFAQLQIDAEKKSIYFVLGLNLPSLLQSGEYEYALLQDDAELAHGVAVIGDYRRNDKQYTENNENKQYQG